MKLKVCLLSLIFFIFSVSTSFAILLDLAGNYGHDPSTVIEFNMFDWAPGAVLLQDVQFTPGDQLQLYAHATLSSFQQHNKNVELPEGYTLDTDFEVSIIMGFGEVLDGSQLIAAGEYSTMQTAFHIDKSSSLNFFKIYLDTTPDADPLEGTGFNDGDLIAWGKVTDAGGNFGINLNSPNPSDPELQLLDQNGNDDWNGTQSVVGVGSSKVYYKSGPLEYDPRYFIDLPATYSLVYQDNTGVNSPFGPNTTDPSKAFDDGLGGKINVTPDMLGLFNGYGPNILLKTDGSTTVSAVPEPATMFLLGSGLIGFVGIGRRKLKRNKA